MENLAFAKLMYLEGLKYSNHNTQIDNKFAILNFDLSITTIIIAACLKKNKNIRNEKGKTKYFPGLVEILETFYNNSDLIQRINDLHTLRNSIQHGDIIPSKWDIDRYKVLVREFFNDICSEVYNKGITFESISLSKLLKSSHEQQLMELIEYYMEKECYSHAFNMIIICLLYRYLLIKENIEPESLTRYHQIYVYPYKQRKLHGEIHPLQEQFLLLSTGISESLNIIALGEFYHTMNNIIKREVPEIKLESSSYWIGQMTKYYINIKEDQIKTMYEELNTILFGTENLITHKTNFSAPIIYDVHIENITKSTTDIYFRILSTQPLIDFQLYLNNNIVPYQKEFHINNQHFQLTNLVSKSFYNCRIEVTQQESSEYGKILGYTEFTFETL